MPYYRCVACGLTGYVAPAHAAARACPNCSAALPDSAKVGVVAGAARGFDHVFPARPEAVAHARRALFALTVPQTTRDTLALLVSELVTNAVRHGATSAGARLELRVSAGAGRVRIAVSDGGPGFTHAPANGDVDPLAVGGQGLVIVAALSDAWGIEVDDVGCTVWCEVAFGEEHADALVAERVTTGYVRDLAIQLAKRDAVALQ